MPHRKPIAKSMLTDALIFHALLALTVGIITAATFILTTRGLYWQEAEQNADTVARFLSDQAQHPLLMQDWPQLQRLAEKTARLDDVLFVEILDRHCEGPRRAHPGFPESEIPPCARPESAATAPVRRPPPPWYAPSKIEAVASVAAPDSRLIGTVQVGFSMDRPKANARMALKRALLVSTFCLVLILIFVFFRLRRALTPALELATFASGINEGSLHRRAAVGGALEIAAVADAFNRMLDRLASTLVSRDLAEQASKAKGQFLANMGHELRTPLNAIIGYSELIAEECRDRGMESILPDLQKIRTAGKMLLDLMNDLLEYSKAESGRMQISRQPISAGEAIQEVADTVEPMARNNRNRLLVEAPDPSLRLFADPLRLRQSLLNLASNACKFTENGAVTLRARAVRRDPGLRCELIVEDTGIGIPAEKMSQIFEAFVQLEPSSTRKYGGTGLGLAISRKFCRMMGGDITVESIPGQGSKFTISLPAAGVSQAFASPAETIRGT